MIKKMNPEFVPLGGEKKGDFLHSATIPCLLFDSLLNLIEINPAGLKLFSTRTREKNLINKSLSEIIPSIKDTQRYDKYLDVIRKGKSYTTQISPPHPNFGDVYLDIHAFKVGDGLGIVITDITAQKKAEEELLTRMQALECMERINGAIREAEDLERLLDSVLETILTIFKCDRVWLLYPCDPNAPYLTVPMERTRAEYPGAFASKNGILNSPELIELEKVMLASRDILVIEPGTKYKIPPSLKAFSVQSQVTIPVYPRVDKPWIFGIHQCSYPRIWSRQEQNLFKEISRRFAEALSSFLFLQNLQESEKRYRTLFNQAGDAIFLINTDNKIRDVNHRACQILELPREEIIGKSYLDFVHPDYQEDSVKRKHGLLSGKTYESYEKIFVRGSGVHFPVEINATSIQLHDGTPKYFQSIVRDITERKQTEKVMSVLYEISKAVNITPDLETLYPQIHESLSKIIDATNFFIALYDDAKDVITFPYFIDEKDEKFEIIDARDSGSLTAEVIKNGKPLLLKKKQIDERFGSPGKTAVGTPAFAWLGVPLRVQKKLIGVIAVQSYANANLYSKKDIKLLESVSEQIAIAIRNKQIEEEKKKLFFQFFLFFFDLFLFCLYL